MTTTITLQQAQNPVTFQLPYPFHVDTEGNILRQDFWQGTPLKVLGFQANINVQRVDLRWSDALDIGVEQAVGMYIVTVDDDANISAWNSPLERVTVTDTSVQQA